MKAQPVIHRTSENIPLDSHADALAPFAESSAGM
jgi:hypothetical protein